MSDGHARWRARRPCDSISIAVTSDSSAMVLSGLIDSISSICWNQNVNQRSVHRAESISIKYYQMTQCDSGFFFVWQWETAHRQLKMAARPKSDICLFHYSFPSFLFLSPPPHSTPSSISHTFLTYFPGSWQQIDSIFLPAVEANVINSSILSNPSLALEFRHCGPPDIAWQYSDIHRVNRVSASISSIANKYQTRMLVLLFLAILYLPCSSLDKFLGFPLKHAVLIGRLLLIMTLQTSSTEDALRPPSHYKLIYRHNLSLAHLSLPLSLSMGLEINNDSRLNA